MVEEHSRFEIWGSFQHPYRHSLSEFAYSHPSMPGVSNLNDAMNWVFAVLYPNSQPAVATVGDLPAAGNTIGDYRVVTDDGDGKSAGYRWEQREGDVAAKWYKIMDVDWSSDSILAAFLDVTQDLYVVQDGKQDLDDAGAVITGVYAGQMIYGGTQANQNLTLRANSGDGVGAQTGYVQVDDNFRPAQDATWDMGTATEQFKDLYLSGTANIGTMAVTSGSITDSSGAIDFGNENLSTTGTIDGGTITGTSLVADDTSDTVTLVPGSYTDTTGSVSFGAANLSTTGTLGAGVATFTDTGETIVIDPDTSGTGNIINAENSLSNVDSEFFMNGPLLGFGQTFQATATGDLVSITTRTRVIGGPTVTTAVCVVYSGTFGAVIATSNSIPVNITNFGSQFSPLDYVWTFTSAPTLTASSTYSFGIYYDATGVVDGSNHLRIGKDSGENYTSGVPYDTIDGGTSWGVEGTGDDLGFIVTTTGGTWGQITSSTGTISLDDEDLITTGTITAGSLDIGQLTVDNVQIDGNTISTTNVNGDLILLPNGTGAVDVQKELTTVNQTVTGTVDITGQLDIDDITLNGSTISTASSNLILASWNIVSVSSSLYPTTSSSYDLGAGGSIWNDLYINGGIRDATNEIAIATLLSFRDAVTGANDGDAIFWDSATSRFLPSTPDSEIDHTTISNLTSGDAGHTQFAMLAGRAGGQILIGGTASGDDLTLESTSDVTKGNIFVRDVVAPETNASYSGGWSGTDLGDGTHYFRDVYTKGELRGFRFENFTSGTLPSASAQNVGRTVWATDNNKAYTDTGGTWQVLGVAKYDTDTVWDGATSVKNVDVSATIEDARNAIWQFKDNANNYEIMGVKIEATSASNVRITSSIDLPAGSYRLTGLE